MGDIWLRRCSEGGREATLHFDLLLASHSKIVGLLILPESTMASLDPGIMVKHQGLVERKDVGSGFRPA